GYLAPEVLDHGAGRATPASDVFALGAVLFEALTLRRPFEGRPGARGPAPSPRRLRGAVPAALDAIVRVALAEDPKERYRDGAALARDLEAFLAGQPVAARPQAAWRRALARPGRTLGSLLVVAASAAVVPMVIVSALMARR